MDRILFAKEHDIVLDVSSSTASSFGGAAIGTIADHDELGGHFFADQGKYLHSIENPFHGPEIGEVHEDDLAIGSPFGAQFRIGLAKIQITIDEIGDYFDGPLDVEILQSAIKQIARNRSDAVALLNGIASDRKEAAIVAHQGDVCPMKSRDEGKAAGSGHGACQQGANGVGNGVVNVKQVQ